MSIHSVTYINLDFHVGIVCVLREEGTCQFADLHTVWLLESWVFTQTSLFVFMLVYVWVCVFCFDLFHTERPPIVLQ